MPFLPPVIMESQPMDRVRQDLKGVAHVHSTRSFDGSCDYAKVRTLLLGAGFDFACMTEHIEQLKQEDVDAVIHECRTHSDDAFLFIPGIEMDCFTIYFLGINQAPIDFRDNLSIYRSLRSNAKLCVLSHPVKANYRYPDWLLRDCDAVEVINCKHDGKFYLRPQSERLLHAIRQSRPEVVALAGLDFHHPEQLCRVHMRLTSEGPLTPDFVLGELKAGNCIIYGDDRPFSDIAGMSRAWLRARIHAMDFAHFIHSSLQRVGFKTPKTIRRVIARIMEGC